MRIDAALDGDPGAIRGRVSPSEPRLIFVNRFFHPDLSATAQLLGDLAFALAAEGAKVHVVTSRILYDDPDAKLPAQEVVKGVAVHRVWTSHYGREKLLGRLIDYLSFYMTAALKLWRLAGASDQIIVKTDPPLFCVPAAWIATRRKAHLINWLQDVYPELAMRRGILSAESRIGRTILKLRNAALQMATCNVAISQRMKQLLIELDVGPGSIAVIPNWSDGEAIYPVPPDQNSLRPYWGLEGKCVIAHSGNLGPVHDLETLRTALAQLVGDSEVTFLFIGGGKSFQDLKAWAKEKGLAEIQFRPYQPSDQLHLSLSAADVHLVSLAPDMEGLAFASKLYGILAAGRPALFIGAKHSELAEILSQADCGVSVESGYPAQLVAAIRALKADPARRRTMGQRARALFEREYDKPLAIAQWRKLLLVNGAKKDLESSRGAVSLELSGRRSDKPAPATAKPDAL